MRAKFGLADPDECEATLSITMPLRYWRLLKGQLNNEFPSFRFGNAISRLIEKACKQFDSTDATDV